MKALPAALIVVGVGIFGGALMRSPALAAFLSYAALAILIFGICWRILLWASAPVPFRIPTTCGQQKSLSWLRRDRIDNPASGLGVLGRMALEICMFRSLSRNNRAQVGSGHLLWRENNAFWLAALAFHWSLLLIVVFTVVYFRYLDAKAEDRLDGGIDPAWLTDSRARASVDA